MTASGPVRVVAFGEGGVGVTFGRRLILEPSG